MISPAIRTILVPTDYSKPATAALQYAGDLAERFASRLIILHADSFAPAPEFVGVLGSPGYFQNVPALVSAAQDKLDEHAGKVLPRSVVRQTLVLDRLPEEAILETAESRMVDLIVMGTHGRSGLSRAVLGSVTEGVLRHADRSVLTLRSSETAEPRDGIGRIVGILDGNGEMLQQINLISELAGLFGADASLVWAIRKGERDPIALDQIRSLVPAEIKEHTEVLELPVGENGSLEIVALSERLAADLLVMGAHQGHAARKSVSDSNYREIIRRAPCPVLTVSGKAGSPGSGRVAGAGASVLSGGRS